MNNQLVKECVKKYCITGKNLHRHTGQCKEGSEIPTIQNVEYHENLYHMYKYVYVCVYIYIYIYIYTCVCVVEKTEEA
jgi:hypothetical protein